VVLPPGSLLPLLFSLFRAALNWLRVRSWILPCMTCSARQDKQQVQPCSSVHTLCMPCMQEIHHLVNLHAQLLPIVFVHEL